ncbi:NO-inducible flavohemoprotein [Thermoactinomyces sp. DSM 45892]|uniref:NO-inducible flavohemoprotein n=1 Tax=Thermoactinomyces sp. DSM 45892 TaxID=1882753 RepID=UPI00089B0612|nr:NO-inducible flavohemoprotein [Thermoactinomyces sp. DSM 45892]SDY02756.1 nitric oxide dioxygenase [Thermoactinomyces sp. DSM 45892]
MLSHSEMEIIRATAPVLKEQGLAITSYFYTEMFKNHPELKNVFNLTHQREGTQPQALANAVYAVAANIDQLESLLPAVRHIAQKHRSVGVKPSQYPIVGKYLLLAIQEVLGDAASPEVIRVWGKAYQILADLFIQIESEMYEEAKGLLAEEFIPAEVIRKEVECVDTVSFYLRPVGLKDFRATFKPGQYISVRVHPKGSEYLQIRQYSLSDVPGKDFYRITVKRESGGDHLPNGVISNHLQDQIQVGDQIEISAPAGEFYVNQTKENKIYLISGGVGLTPMQSILKDVAHTQTNRKVIYVHSSRNESYHAFSSELKQITSEHPQVEKYVNYDERVDASTSADHVGQLDIRRIPQGLDPQADYYLCGPKGFMKAMIEQLTSANIPMEQIHYEFFGPNQAL